MDEKVCDHSDVGGSHVIGNSSVSCKRRNYIYAELDV